MIVWGATLHPVSGRLNSAPGAARRYGPAARPGRYSVDVARALKAAATTSRRWGYGRRPLQAGRGRLRSLRFGASREAMPAWYAVVAWRLPDGKLDSRTRRG